MTTTIKDLISQLYEFSEGSAKQASAVHERRKHVDVRPDVVSRAAPGEGIGWDAARPGKEEASATRVDGNGMIDW